MMTLLNLIESKKKAIVTAWLARALEVYPDDSRRFFTTGKDRFANPVGQTLAEEMGEVLAQMVASAAPESWAASLTRTLKIRAVQEMRPAGALWFLFQLKSVLGDVLKTELRDDAVRSAFLEFEVKIDTMALMAFEIYAKHRERVFEVRISDVKRQVSHLLKRSAFFTNDEEASSKEESDSK